MSRRTDKAASKAAERASEAARVLQARGQEAKTETPEPQKEPQGRRPEPRNEPRRLALEEIEKRREQELEPQGEQEPPAAEPEPQPEPQAEAPVETPQAEAPAAPEPEQPTLETVRVKVDGEEFDVPKADVDAAGGVSAYQRERASENRLRKANEALAESKRMQAQMAELAKQLKPVEQPPSVAKTLQESIDTIRWGTPEESASALQRVIELANPRVNEEQIIANALMRMQRDQAVSKFREEFSDVVGNPLLMKLSIALETDKLAELQKSGQRPDWGTLYRSIGNEVRSLVRPSQPTQDALPKDSTSPPVDKEARKASIVNLPTAAARAAVPEAQKPETRADVLNDMKKARGIPTG